MILDPSKIMVFFTRYFNKPNGYHVSTYFKTYDVVNSIEDTVIKATQEENDNEQSEDAFINPISVTVTEYLDI